MSGDYRKGAMDLWRMMNASIGARLHIYGNRKSTQKCGSTKQRDQIHGVELRDQPYIMYKKSRRIRPL